MKPWQTRILIIPLVLTMMSCLLTPTKTPTQPTPGSTHSSVSQPTESIKTNTPPPTNTPVPSATETKSIPPSPTNTKIPTVIIPGSDAPVVEFDYASSNHTTPEDVFKETGFMGAGGGGDDCSICSNAGTDDGSPFINCTVERVEWHESICIYSCGWEQNEKMNYKVRYPDGREEIIEELLMNQDISYCARFSTEKSDPVGAYLVTLEGERGILSQEIEVYIPDEPRVYRDKGKILLLNFYPGENVRVLGYKSENGKHKLESWSDYQVDLNGQLVILDNTSYVTFVIGDHSGEFSIRGAYSVNKNACPGLSHTQFPNPLVDACVSTSGLELIYQNEVEVTSEIMGTIPDGTELNLDYWVGPVCLENGIRWKAYFYNSKHNYVSGWVSELSDGAYYLAPCDEGPG